MVETNDQLDQTTRSTRSAELIRKAKTKYNIHDRAVDESLNVAFNATEENIPSTKMGDTPAFGKVGAGDSKTQFSTVLPDNMAADGG
jgi:hypothetical protein